MKIYQNEIFGPVLLVLRAPDFDPAVELVNKHEYGNGTAKSPATATLRVSRTRSHRHGRVQLPIPVPMAFQSFGGWKRSLFGDHHMHGPQRGALLHLPGGGHDLLTDRHPRRCRIQDTDMV